MAIGFFEIIKYIGYVPQLAGTVMATVAFVEGVKAGDAGPEKKQAVLDSLKANWETISQNFTTKVDFNALIPLISLLIDLAVTVYNLFWKKPVPPPVPPTAVRG